MSEEEYNPVTPEQRSLPPEGFVYPEGYVPASLDDWYPVRADTGEPLSTPKSGYRRLGGEWVKDTDMVYKRTPADKQAEGLNHRKDWKGPSFADPIPSKRCEHIKKDGNQCNRWSLKGASKCVVHIHGNAVHGAERRILEARLRMVDSANTAVEVLEDLVKPGVNDAIRLKAATEILDRVGIKGGIDVKVEVEHKIDPGQVVRDRIAKIKENNQKAIENVVDAEIVDEDLDDEIIGEVDDD